MSFDVASVKPTKSTDRPVSNVPLTIDNTYASTGGLFSATNGTLRTYLWFAYKTQQLPIGMPDWGNRDRFDIEAKSQGIPPRTSFA